MNQFEAKIIMLLAEHSLNVTPVSRALYIHRNSIMYHIRGIKKRTGKDPLDFYDMCELIPEASFILDKGIDERTYRALEAIGRNAHGGEL